jgi:hypothetical protein
MPIAAERGIEQRLDGGGRGSNQGFDLDQRRFLG